MYFKCDNVLICNKYVFNDELLTAFKYETLLYFNYQITELDTLCHRFNKKIFVY